MNTAEYIKHYLVHDIVLACVLVFTGYAWYQLLAEDESVQEDQIVQESVADLVPVNPELTDG